MWFQTTGCQYKSHERISSTWLITSGCPKIILLYVTSSIHIPSDGKTRLWIVGSLISTVCRNALWMTFCSSALGTTFSSDCCWNCIRRFFLPVSYCKLYLVNTQKANFKTSNILSQLFSLPHVHSRAHVCAIHKHKLSNILWYTRHQILGSHGREIIMLCDAKSCSLVDRYGYFGGTYCLHLHCRGSKALVSHLFDYRVPHLRRPRHETQ